MKIETKTAIVRISLSIAIVAADQTTKFLARSLLAPQTPLDVIPGFFSLALVFNEGAAWGIMQGFRHVFVFLGVAMLGLLWFCHDRIFGSGMLNSIASGLLSGGIVGNIVDRVIAGRVTDFLDFYHGTWHFPCFNIADCAISVGVVLFLIAEFRKEGE